jgi:cell division protein ZipA
MEDNFRNALIIISAIVIAAIFIHGYWTIRKQKNPYKLKTENERVEPETRGFDRSGFDQDGVSKPKVISTSEQSKENIQLEAHVMSDEACQNPDKPMPGDVPLPSFEDKEQTSNFGALLNETEEIPEHLKQQALSDVPAYDDDLFPEQAVAATEVQPEKIEIKPEPEPVYQQPVTHAKPEVAKPVQRKKSVRKPTIKKNQMEINFGDESTTKGNKTATKKQEPTLSQAPAAIEPQVIVLSVVMPQGQQMSGAALLPTLLTLGMKFGEMDIFHRHEDNAGNGQVTFSLANMMNPGTFDLDAMENFSTQGITLFMTLPNAGDAFEVFKNMLNAAKQLAVEFHGQLLDDKRSVMTKQTEQHYTSIIREFERKNRIGAI